MKKMDPFDREKKISKLLFILIEETFEDIIGDKQLEDVIFCGNHICELPDGYDGLNIKFGKNYFIK